LNREIEIRPGGLTLRTSKNTIATAQRNQGCLEKFDLRDPAEMLLGAKEQNPVQRSLYSPGFVTPAASNKIKRDREANVSRCPQRISYFANPLSSQLTA
jgi:hypothetical protein